MATLPVAPVGMVNVPLSLVGWKFPVQMVDVQLMK
jgi:hypothetical protein